MQGSIGLNGCGGVSLPEEAARPGAGWRLTPFVLAAATLLGALALAKLAIQPVAGRTADSGAPWAAHIRAVDDALALNDLGAAEQAWHAAYLAALGSRRWEGRLAVGDAALRIGEAAGGRKTAEAKARTNYMAALLHARERGSLDGVLRAAEAFAALGDREVADRCFTIAERVAAEGRDPQAGGRVRLLRERLTARMTEGEGVP